VTPPKEIEVTVEPPLVIADPPPAPVQIVVEETATAPEVTVEAPADPEADPEPNPDGDGTWGWESNESKTAGPWRGLKEESFRSFGEYHIQNRTGILSKDLADGGIRFWIPENYKAAGWVLGTRLDTRLTPGGSIEFGPTGALRQHSGGVRVLAALER
jgi:hypothetical protein